MVLYVVCKCYAANVMSQNDITVVAGILNVLTPNGVMCAGRRGLGSNGLHTDTLCVIVGNSGRILPFCSISDLGVLIDWNIVIIHIKPLKHLRISCIQTNFRHQ